jgi:hypothetical protein
MRDPLLADALDGFDAVPGDHSAALERLAACIDRSASGGRAAARARSLRQREGRLRGWSSAAAAVFLAGAIGGGVWLLGDGVPVDDNTAPKIQTYSGHSGEVVEILPPVTVIENDAVPAAAPSDPSAVKFDPHEVPSVDRLPPPDTLITAAFRRYLAVAAASLTGPVKLSFEVDPDGRPQNVEAVEAPSPTAAEAAVALLTEGPNWPARPSRKLITIK